MGKSVSKSERQVDAAEAADPSKLGEDEESVEMTVDTVKCPTPPLQSIWKSRKDVVHTSGTVKRSELLNNLNNNNCDVDEEPSKLQKLRSPISFMKSKLSKLLMKKKKDPPSASDQEEANKTFRLPLTSSSSNKILMSARLARQNGLRPSTHEMPLVRGASEASVVVMQVAVKLGGTKSKGKADGASSSSGIPSSKTHIATLKSKGKESEFKGTSSLPSAAPGKQNKSKLNTSGAGSAVTIGSLTGTASSVVPTDPSDPSIVTAKDRKTNKVRPNKRREPFQTGCCSGPAPPPAYLDYTCGGGGGSSYSRGGRCSTGNPILDRLKNVDVIEELQYNVPDKASAGDCGVGSGDEGFDYFYVCNECGERSEAGVGCPCPKGGKSSKTNPVTYSRRQRFNFTSAKNACSEDEEDGPPFKWPGNSKICRCSCCVAGLRRHPNCGCKCCLQNGRDRVLNPFDELPVGKNPEPKDLEDIQRTLSNENEEEDDDDDEDCDTSQKESSEDVYPRESGVYFYDAKTGLFVRQTPRTPTPCVIPVQVISKKRRSSDAAPRAPQQTTRDPCAEMNRIYDILNHMPVVPPRNPPKNNQECHNPVQPIVLPPIYGPCDENQDLADYCEATLNNLICPPGKSLKASQRTAKTSIPSNGTQNVNSSQQQQGASHVSPPYLSSTNRTISQEPENKIKSDYPVQKDLSISSGSGTTASTNSEK